MICPKCRTEAVKLGTRPIIRKGVIAKRRQAYLCKNPRCYYQWVVK